MHTLSHGEAQRLGPTGPVLGFLLLTLISWPRQSWTLRASFAAHELTPRYVSSVQGPLLSSHPTWQTACRLPPLPQHSHCGMCGPECHSYYPQIPGPPPGFCASVPRASTQPQKAEIQEASLMPLSFSLAISNKFSEVIKVLLKHSKDMVGATHLLQLHRHAIQGHWLGPSRLL